MISDWEVVYLFLPNGLAKMETDYKLKKAGVELAKLLIDFTTLARNEPSNTH
jgi:hypothetical protein